MIKRRKNDFRNLFGQRRTEEKLGKRSLCFYNYLRKYLNTIFTFCANQIYLKLVVIVLLAPSKIILS